MDKTILITGGAKGIGKFTASFLASQGYRVIVNYRSDDEHALKLASDLSDLSKKKCIAIKADIASKEGSLALINQINDYGIEKIDVLIHNAGPYIAERKKMTEYSFDEWDQMVNGNLSAVFYLSKHIIPIMREHQWGRIVTFGYDRVDSVPGWVYRSAFASAKSGLASLTKTIALEEAENGITANMICPGDIEGDWKELSIKDAIGSEDHENPVGRPGSGEDIARVLSFLIHEDSGFITGAIIPVTGGKDVLGKIYRK
ncbi:SDR family oxidoreductase [Jeotgalibacillus haloalkalitolerans]|uniref:SDR family oxidoreductase n=1 Tax=Jeotgalibacillus haloalkalitolerans TaxID=3104292 RepID=A0ABU5KMJ2_9BACL|nr:SDR family oxidoreductase [Jeotgalibacillus sp. HH7-29]MDZ5711930.1 SDR family oxidoreductase [Jeotgalibacillus sp. HH7-29]